MEYPIVLVFTFEEKEYELTIRDELIKTIVDVDNGKHIPKRIHDNIDFQNALEKCIDDSLINLIVEADAYAKKKYNYNITAHRGEKEIVDILLKDSTGRMLRRAKIRRAGCFCNRSLIWVQYLDLSNKENPEFLIECNGTFLVNLIW
jgi:hypothetical protein